MYLFFDTETTGKNPDTARMVQLAWSRYNEDCEEIERKNPERPGSAHERERKQGEITTNKTGNRLEMAKGTQGITEKLIYPFCQ